MPLVGAVLLSGCGSRRSSITCEWVHTTRASLLDDIRRAEDIAIRHADSLGYREGWRATRENCETILFGAVASSRGLSVDDVRQARAQLDHRSFDWAVNFPVAGLTLAAAWVIARRVRRRFDNERVPLLAAVALSSVGLAVAVIAIGQLWAFAVEGVRIGNGHLSYRAFRIPWAQHRVTTFTLVVIAVWAITWIQHQAARTGHPGTNP